jgi:hypothetical protein
LVSDLDFELTEQVLGGGGFLQISFERGICQLANLEGFVDGFQSLGESLGLFHYVGRIIPFVHGMSSLGNDFLNYTAI